MTVDTEKHAVIIIPGLGDDRPQKIERMEKLINKWESKTLTPIIHAVHWRDGMPYLVKLAKLLALIDSIAREQSVSLVGTSAGASMALNAFMARKERVNKAVNVCGRLSTGNHLVRSLEHMAATSPAFYQSVQAAERDARKLSNSERARILTIRPFFGDELVPRDTAFLPGAQNRWVFSGEHGLSILFALAFPKPILDFIQNEPLH